MRSAILLVAYGIGSDRGRHALRDFDILVRRRWPELPVRWAYTSCLLRQRMARARQKSDSVFKAVLRLALERFDALAVQPLQMIPGQEYDAVRDAVAQAASEGGLRCRVGAPLLSAPEDVCQTAAALLRHLPDDRRPDEDVVFMGHGTRHDAMARYVALAQAVHARDPRVHVGAMSGAVLLENILPTLLSPRVWLAPLLCVVGRHALEDMAGRGHQSWRSRIEAAGHVCQPVLRGTAEYVGVAEIWLRHLEEAVQTLTESEG